MIDFDDAGFGWHMFELATALYFLPGRPALLSRSKRRCWRGIHAVKPLTDADRGTLALFLMLRGFHVPGLDSYPQRHTDRDRNGTDVD